MQGRFICVLRAKLTEEGNVFHLPLGTASQEIHLFYHCCCTFLLTGTTLMCKSTNCVCHVANKSSALEDSSLFNKNQQELLFERNLGSNTSQRVLEIPESALGRRYIDSSGQGCTPDSKTAKSGWFS